MSIPEDKGALVIYHAATRAEVKRLSTSHPSGKNKFWIKMTFTDGTSH